MTNEEKLFEVYLHELIEWNNKFNLTSVTDPEEIKVRHFEDSLSVLQAIDLKDESVADVGAGAGFPGIPLKIVRPGIRLTLIEATRKKVDFLKHLIKKLGLDVEVVWGRAEELAKDAKYKGKFDVVVSRAVAKLPDLAGYCIPLLKKGGVFAAMKQDDVVKELEQAKEKLDGLSAKVKAVKKATVGGIVRSIVLIEKS
ncbi:MAG TPA: 16S rRNA (guanine(527)-N(7))-methyltransferase RsmG [Candidatus Omnitrophota bacterium]|nr:16S rRNA (guanine(527)-N(7))-methyltransferase RsmG [Candidatus Omnitrophota bacterium]